MYNIHLKRYITAWKVSKYGVFSGPNTGKYGPKKTPYLDTFHAVYNTLIWDDCHVFLIAVNLITRLLLDENLQFLGISIWMSFTCILSCCSNARLYCNNILQAKNKLEIASTITLVSSALELSTIFSAKKSFKVVDFSVSDEKLCLSLWRHKQKIWLFLFFTVIKWLFYFPTLFEVISGHFKSTSLSKGEEVWQKKVKKSDIRGNRDYFKSTSLRKGGRFDKVKWRKLEYEGTGAAKKMMSFTQKQ